MANIKISELTAATSVATTDELEINAGGTSKKATAQKLLDLAASATQTLTNKTFDTAGTGNVFKVAGQQITYPSGWLFGDGSDGNVTISGTVTLTRDMHYNNLTLSAGAELLSANFRIHVAGTLDLSGAPAGAIKSNGISATSRTGAAAIATGACGASRGGGNGALGTTAAGSTGTSANGGLFSTSSASGAGGASGTAISGAAGASLVVGYGRPNLPFIGTTPGGASYAYGGAFVGAGGSGGSSGSGDGTTAGGNGGGGGSGGGTVAILANTVATGTNSTASIIQAIGGTGADGASPASGTAGGGGGGSGGGGGLVVIAYGSRTGSTITNAIDVSGGAGGNGGTGRTYWGGGGGGSGGSGAVFIWQVGAAPSVTESVAGTTGSSTTSTALGSGAAANTKKVSL